MVNPKRPTDPLSLVHENLSDIKIDRDYWRSLAIKLGGALVITSGIAIVGIAAAIFFRENKYFATSPTGQITPLIPLNKPTTTSIVAQRFAVNTITEALSLNFRQWRTQLAQSEPNFTTSGYKSFLDQLEKTNWLKTLQDGLYTATVNEISRPVMVYQGPVSNGVYGYVVEVPLTLTLENGNERKRQELKARIIVVRVPTSEKPDGLAVDKVIVS